MGLQLFWPPLAILVLFVGMVIMLLLRFGGRFLKQAPFPSSSDHWADAAYEQRVSYA